VALVPFDKVEQEKRRAAPRPWNRRGANEETYFAKLFTASASELEYFKDSHQPVICSSSLVLDPDCRAATLLRRISRWNGAATSAPSRSCRSS